MLRRLPRDAGADHRHPTRIRGLTKIGKAAASGDMRALNDLGISWTSCGQRCAALADTGKRRWTRSQRGSSQRLGWTLILARAGQAYRGGHDGRSGPGAEARGAQAKLETLTGEDRRGARRAAERPARVHHSRYRRMGAVREWLGRERAGAAQDMLGPIARVVDVL